MAQRNKPELLAPAGDLERLRAALDYGADAVYLGRESFSMRAAASNFHSAEQLHEAVALAHQYGKKVYLTCNTGCRRRCAHPGRPGTAGNGTKACAGYGDPYVHTNGHRQLQHLPGAV